MIWKVVQHCVPVMLQSRARIDIVSRRICQLFDTCRIVNFFGIIKFRAWNGSFGSDI
jgi:hypothetical protein